MAAAPRDKGLLSFKPARHESNFAYRCCLLLLLQIRSVHLGMVRELWSLKDGTYLIHSYFNTVYDYAGTAARAAGFQKENWG